MNPHEDLLFPAVPPGPLQEAYLQRDVHPDEKIEEKATHAAIGGEHAAFPKTDVDVPEEERWKFR